MLSASGQSTTSLPGSEPSAAHAATAAATPRCTTREKVLVMPNFLAMARMACAIAWSAIASAASSLPTVAAVSAPLLLLVRAARPASLLQRDAQHASPILAPTSPLLPAAPLASHE